MKENKTKPCRFLDLGKARVERGFPEITCRAYSKNSCPKKDGRKNLTAMCFRKG
jgi:hypothetical protein